MVRSCIKENEEADSLAKQTAKHYFIRTRSLLWSAEKPRKNILDIKTKQK